MIGFASGADGAGTGGQRGSYRRRAGRDAHRHGAGHTGTCPRQLLAAVGTSGCTELTRDWGGDRLARPAAPTVIDRQQLGRRRELAVLAAGRVASGAALVRRAAPAGIPGVGQ